MQSLNSIDNLLESVSKLSLDDQLMIVEIIHKRVIEEKRKQFAESIRESREEYFSNKITKGNVSEFLKDIDNEL